MSEPSSNAAIRASGSFPITPWTAPAAVAAAVAIFLVAIATGTLLAMAIGELAGWWRSTGAGTNAAAAGTWRALWGMTWLGAVQATIVVLVLVVAGWFGGRRAEVLQLTRRPSVHDFLVAAGGMVALLAPYNLAVYLLTPDSMIADLKPFAEFIRSDARWLTVVVIALGAPVSEEILFRGFLLPALAQSKLGFLGASLITTLAWSSLHLGYSLAGLIEVTLIGLIFCWVLWRTANLWITIACHAAYNGLLLALLTVIPI